MSERTPRPARTLLSRARGGPLGVARAVVDRVDPSRHRGRRLWRGADRVHIGIPAVARESGADLAGAVEKALSGHPGVEWATVNAALAVAVVAFTGGDGDTGLPDPEIVDDLVDIVEILEEQEVERREGGLDHHPATGHSSTAVTQATTALAADVVGLGIAGLGRVLRRSPLPVELASAASFVDHQPRLRAAVERSLGRQRADVLLALGNAAAQGLGQGTSGLLVDAAYRAMQVAEARATTDAWEEAEPRLTDTPHHAAAQADDAASPEARPVPLPAGPIERHGDQVGAFALGGFAGTVAFSGDPRRAAGVALSTLPKAGRMGREGFATTLGRVLSKRGVLIVEPTALRRMDRLDTVVLDAEALTTGALMLGDLVALPDADGVTSDLEVLVPRVHELFDPGHPERERGLVDEGVAWSLAPLEDVTHPSERADRGTSQTPSDSDGTSQTLSDSNGTSLTSHEAGRALLADGATHVLALWRADRLEAVVGVLPEPAAAAEALSAAARRAGVTLVLGTSDGSETDPSGRADRAVPGGDGLLGSVRALQDAGCGVLVVSRDRRALAAADLGVGVSQPDGTAPWGAHVLVGDDLGNAALIIEGVKVARGVSSRSVNLARAGTVLGAAMATAGTAPRGSSLAGLSVNGAAAVSLGAGAWSASELGRRVVVPGVSRTPWHVMPAATVLDRVASSPRGLSTDEAQRRLRADPAAEETQTTLGRAFLDELNNPLTPVLAGGAVLSAAIGAVVDAAIVVGVTAASALIGGVQRVVTDRAVAGLLERSSTRTRVLRSGHHAGVGADEVVVGDVIELGPDDVVPADCRVLSADALELDESSLTGESLPVVKSADPVIARSVADRRSMIYEGTTVATGRGRAVVVATGSSTEVGRSTAAARANAPVAGVDERLAGITRVTTPLALASAAAVVAAGAVRGLPTQENLHSGVGLAVASVPEGLPFIVSAAQLASARRLSSEGALVRNPKTIEAVGRVDVLCFDKTGTLTEGRLALSAISDGVKLRPTDRLRKRQRRVLAAALRATPRPKPGERLAHLTDRAVVFGAQSFDVDPAHKRRGWWPVASLEFDPSRSYHATLGEIDVSPDDGSADSETTDRLISVKGAPEVVIERCADWAGDPLDADARQRLVDHTELLAGQGMRVLAVAEKVLPGRGGDGEVVDDDVADLSFVGFVGFTDPVRSGASASVRDLREAGVQVVMITGDHPSTAEAVADELDVLNGGVVVTGTELDTWTDDELDEVIAKVRVIARGTPAHKVRAVQAFQRLGRTVAMTGDGANDAPAIRLADVGIALGRRGTPAARAAADLVITDDRLETILAALVEGRAMWASVRDALGVLVGGNLGEIGFTVLGATATGTSPLNARQLLLVNLLTDLAPSLALAVRAPEPAAARTLLAEGPEASLGQALNSEITLRAVATAGGASLAWVQARATPLGSPRRASTVALVGLVGTQLGQTVAAGGYRSPLVVGATVVSAGALFAVVQTPGVSQFFGCTPLGPIAWSQATGSAVAATAASMVGPELVRRYGPVVAPEGSALADVVDRLHDVQEAAAQRYTELQDRAAAALNG